MDTNILDIIKNNFTVVDNPKIGGFYILPSGESIKVNKDHVDIDKFLIKNKLIEPYDVDFSDGSKTMDDLNSVRIRARGGKDSWISPYIVLPKHRLTNEQYDTLLGWLDFVLNSHGHVLVHTDNESDFKSYNRDFTSDEIIDKIKRYYSSGILYESINETDDSGHILTDEQSNYFRNSKARNTGKLVVCYHVTNKEFDEFSKDAIGTGISQGTNNLGDGFYFTDDIMSYEGKYRKEVYLNIEKPYYLGVADNTRQVIELIENSG